MLTAIFFTPSASAIFFASPFNANVGRPPFTRTTSTSTQRTPRLQPVPSAFMAASFTAKRPAYLSYLFLNFSQYATSSGVYTRRRNLSRCASITSWMRFTSATSMPSPTIIAHLIAARLGSAALTRLYCQDHAATEDFFKKAQQQTRRRAPVTTFAAVGDARFKRPANPAAYAF